MCACQYATDTFLLDSCLRRIPCFQIDVLSPRTARVIRHGLSVLNFASAPVRIITPLIIYFCDCTSFLEKNLKIDVTTTTKNSYQNTA